MERPLIAAMFLSCVLPLRASAQFDDAALPAERRGPVSFRDGVPYRPEVRYPGSGELEVSVGVLSRSFEGTGSLLLLAPVIDGWYAPDDRYGLLIRFPMVQGNATKDGASTRDIFLGNVTAGAFWQPLRGRTGLRAGVEIATPTSDLSDDPERRPFDVLVYEDASAMRGHRMRWLWAPDRLGVAVPARLSRRIGEAGVVALDAAAAAMVPLGEVGDEVELLARLGAEGGIAGEDLVAGLRGFAVFLANDRTLQLSVEPFVRWRIGRAFLAGAFTLNLDAPAGFSFREGRTWGLHVGGGVELGEPPALSDEPTAGRPSGDPVS